MWSYTDCTHLGGTECAGCDRWEYILLEWIQMTYQHGPRILGPLSHQGWYLICCPCSCSGTICWCYIMQVGISTIRLTYWYQFFAPSKRVNGYIACLVVIKMTQGLFAGMIQLTTKISWSHLSLAYPIKDFTKGREGVDQSHISGGLISWRLFGASCVCDIYQTKNVNFGVRGTGLASSSNKLLLQTLSTSRAHPTILALS